MPWFKRVPENEYYESVNKFWFHVLGDDDGEPCSVCLLEHARAKPQYCPRGQKLHDQAYEMDVGHDE